MLHTELLHDMSLLSGSQGEMEVEISSGEICANLHALSGQNVQTHTYTQVKIESNLRGSQVRDKSCLPHLSLQQERGYT